MTEENKRVTHKSACQAVAAAVREVRVLGKSDRNKFDGYDFASIDKFLALVNPICGRNGLFPMVSLDSFEAYENTNSKGGKSTWARFSYSITIYHESGEHLPPVSIMVSVAMNGAQASGTAQSYALKQFFRSLLMIATGDKDDADLLPTEQHHQTSVPRGPNAEDISRASEYLGDAETLDDLRLRWSNLAGTIQRNADVIKAKDNRKAQLQADADHDAAVNGDDLGGDGIPQEIGG
jgi:hypothetical protein